MELLHGANLSPLHGSDSPQSRTQSRNPRDEQAIGEPSASLGVNRHRRNLGTQLVNYTSCINHLCNQFILGNIKFFIICEHWGDACSWRTPPWKHDGVIKWKPFPCYWSFVRGIHRSPVDSPHKGQGRKALVFSLMFAWRNGSAHSRNAGESKRNGLHCDVTVKLYIYIYSTHFSILWLLMDWWRKCPGYQQPWYWPHSPGIFCSPWSLDWAIQVLQMPLPIWFSVWKLIHYWDSSYDGVF